MKSAVLYRARNTNCYLYDRIQKQNAACHPLFFYILEMADRGDDPDAWLRSLTADPVILENVGTFSLAEITHYCRKYHFLKNAGFLGEIDNPRRLGLRIVPADIEKALANARQITFEVTDQCNLDCRYCGYGPLYSGYDRRDHQRLDIRAARRLLDWLTPFWTSDLCLSRERAIYLSFYGGEPLLEIPLIREIMAHACSLPLPAGVFDFTMTTNGVLLERHMEFLAEHDFRLLISLDGDEAANSHRKFKNGAASFQKIYDNAVRLRRAYPEYFRRRVNFNAVLHNQNSVPGVYRFFRDHFGKTPAISPLNTNGVNPERRDEFWETYANVEDSLFEGEDYSRMEREMFVRLPNVRNVSVFLHRFLDFSFDNYNEMFAKEGGAARRFPTGSCLPFSQKLFMTVNGKILACERISQEHELGRADADGVHMDFQTIADYYNRAYDALARQCQVCYNSDHCAQCVFNLDWSRGVPLCRGIMNQREYGEYLSVFLDYLEAKPAMYRKIFSEVAVE